MGDVLQHAVDLDRPAPDVPPRLDARPDEPQPVGDADADLELARPVGLGEHGDRLVEDHQVVGVDDGAVLLQVERPVVRVPAVDGVELGRPDDLAAVQPPVDPAEVPQALGVPQPHGQPLFFVEAGPRDQQAVADAGHRVVGVADHAVLALAVLVAGDLLGLPALHDPEHALPDLGVADLRVVLAHEPAGLRQPDQPGGVHGRGAGRPQLEVDDLPGLVPDRCGPDGAVGDGVQELLGQGAGARLR